MRCSSNIVISGPQYKGRNAGFRETDDISDENTNPIPTPAPATCKDYLIKWYKPLILLVVSEVHREPADFGISSNWVEFVLD